MTTTVHFCVESLDPRLGGMEESALRLLHLLDCDETTRFVAYVTEFSEMPETVSTSVIDVAVQVRRLIEPAIDKLQMARREKTRLQVLLMKDAVQRQMASRPADRHLLLSFYLSTAGFVAQHVANQLHIPHIACSRGSDVGREIYNEYALPSVLFVVQRATYVVTTCLEHSTLLDNTCSRRERVHTIYNSLPGNIRPAWARQKSDRVKLVSLGGYSVKKGTALLLESTAGLLDEGLPLELFVRGRTNPRAWNPEISEAFVRGYGSSFSLGGVIERSEVQQFLLGGDIYCSGSISEGCSNATMLAFGLGMPIVSSATGALLDIGAGFSHIALTSPANQKSFAEGLRQMVLQVQGGGPRIDIDRLQQSSKCLLPDFERTQWLKVIRLAAASND